MKPYEVVSNGRRFLFHEYKNTTEPCPQCGVPACGREDILWYEKDGKRIAIIFDGGYFDLALEEFFEKNVTPENYDQLPNFMKEWNELTGWEECSDYNGYELDIDDFITSMELLRQCELGQWITEQDIDDLQKLARSAQESNVALKIVRG